MTKGRSRERLTDVLDRFIDLFEPTKRLAERLIAENSNPQEILLLLCARLDALASCVARADRGNHDSFIDLVVNYGGHRDLLQSVSLGNLYYELGFHRWLMDGMLPKPGRVVRFSPLDDPIIELLEQSDIPLTCEAARAFITKLIKCIERNFRCRPGQSLKRATIAKLGNVDTALQRDFTRSRIVEPNALVKAVRPLLRSVTVSELLYRNFRNQAVHGIEVRLDEKRFFREQIPYWQHLYSDYYGSFMLLNFPAPFLLSLLRNCLTTLRRALLEKGTVPPDIHWCLFGHDLGQLHLLDRDRLPESSTLRLQRIARR